MTELTTFRLPPNLIIPHTNLDIFKSLMLFPTSLFDVIDVAYCPSSPQLVDTILEGLELPPSQSIYVSVN